MAEIDFSAEEKEDISYVASLPYKWDKLKNSTVLISGGTGFIGSYLIAVLQQRNKEYGKNIKVISLSRHARENRQGVTFIASDVTERIELNEPIDYIVHLASNTHPAQYSIDPVGTVTTNVLGCNNLLKLGVEKSAKRFLLASSVEIYGNGTPTPISESYCGYIDCNTVRAGYNEAKRVSESLSKSYMQQYGLDCVVARLSRVFGPDKKNDSKAIAQFLNKAVHGEDIVLKSLGNQRFSYCYVIDAVSGLLKVLLDGVSGEAYNISADDDGNTLGDYAQFIAKLAQRRVIFDIAEEQGASKAVYALLDCAKLKALGWSPKYTVESALKRTYEILNKR